MTLSDSYGKLSDRTPEQLRREAVQILQRRRRGLPAYHGGYSPDPAAPSDDQAAAILARGESQAERGQRAQALLTVQTAIGLSAYGGPVRADALCTMGELRLADGHIQSARAAFIDALRTHPTHIAARLGLVETFRGAHQPERGIPVLLETIHLVDDEALEARLHLMLAALYREAGHPEAALRVLRVYGRLESLTPLDRLRLFPPLLVPTDGPSRLLLLILLLAILVAIPAYGSVAALGVGVIGLLLYALVQWWRHDLPGE